jgi:hypothetical protein
MKFTQTFSTVFLAVIAITSAHSPSHTSNSHVIEPPKSFDDPQYQVTECGGHVETPFGSIAYKTESYITANERCVWTIRSPSARSYSVEVIAFGIEPEAGETGILATCLQNMTVAMPNVAINGSGQVSIPSACPVLIITFYSGVNVSGSRGFALIYTEVSGSNGIAPTSEHHLFTEKQGHIRYPMNVGQNFSKYETSTFVFPPPENIFSADKETLIVYTRDKPTIGDTGGRIRIYRFHPSTLWTHNETSGSDDSLSGAVEYKIWTIDDLAMAIFRSADFPEGPGFHITYTHLPRN